ncbi:MoxR-like ATPase [Salinibacter ruber]|uniref:AAA family ATPase n=1 Tax=Salinibacter ruber TaxID=146919 RepID=UPI00216932D5|nr:AAA family ATPase [Salinibacter ruber]MCS3635891.1 MoxR-like ATPase [Salinibacter ruber]MCS3715434.1 MoxR-like ATPase [Salinibacter ruber]
MPDESQNPSDEEGNSEVVKLVLEEIKKVYDKYFSREKNISFEIKDKKNDSKPNWKLNFVMPAKKDGEEHIIGVESTKGRKKSEHQVRFKVVKDKDGTIKFAVRGNAKSKSFDILTLEKESNEWISDSEEVNLKYSGKSISDYIKNVWFPGEKEYSSPSLEIPLKVDWGWTKEKPGGWPTFSKFEVPLVRVNNSDGEYVLKEGIKKREEKWLNIGLSVIVYWILCNVYNDGGNLRDNGLPDGFPKAKDYRPERPVNLDPTDVHQDLEEKGLYFPWHVIESACAALNAGKNVIFTGPPGSGKSKLASFLSRQATGEKPLMATASPAWTTGDLLGRYMPRRDDHGLEFSKGFFLRAVGEEEERSRWLVVDEFNRADIDACFGELFSVLAGDSVELPYKKEIENNESTFVEKPVRIVSGTDEEEGESYVDYQVPEEFRLIGTMNDADRSGLNDLSFALMRRFAIIRVEAPRIEDVQDIIETRVKEVSNNLNLHESAWDVSKGKTKRCSLKLIEEEICTLFTSKPKDNENYNLGENYNLVGEGVVGISVAEDVIRFVGEGIRSEIDDNNLERSEIKNWDINDGLPELARMLTLSYLSLATVLQIFPQLEALSMGADKNKDKLTKAVLHIFRSFHLQFDTDDLGMLRVKHEGERYIIKRDETISSFLFRDLKSRFPHHAEQWRRALEDYLPEAN